MAQHQSEGTEQQLACRTKHATTMALFWKTVAALGQEAISNSGLWPMERTPGPRQSSFGGFLPLRVEKVVPNTVPCCTKEVGG